MFPILPSPARREGEAEQTVNLKEVRGNLATPRKRKTGICLCDSDTYSVKDFHLLHHAGFDRRFHDIPDHLPPHLG